MAIKLKQSDVGRFCLVKWDDVGLRESIILEVDSDRRWVKVFDGDGTHSVEREQIRSVSNKYLEFKNSGF